MTYPILLDLRGQRVVVIGGGKVAARKVRDLLDADAHVTVISPALHPDLAALADRIDVHMVGYQAGALAELRPLLVFACTDDSAVNQQIADEARELGTWVNVAGAADKDGAGDFSSMAAIRRGAITIALATNGESPALATHLRDQIAALIGEEYAMLAKWLGDLRPLVKAQVSADKRRDLWHAILDSPAIGKLRAGDEAGARAIIDALVAQAMDESHF